MATLQAGLRSVPLRVKLVAAVLALVLAGLVLIAVASTVALRMYLINQIDRELTNYMNQAVAAVDLSTQLKDAGKDPRVRVFGPTDYLFVITSTSGVASQPAFYDNNRLTPADLPPLTVGAEAIADQMTAVPVTTRSINGKVRWRMDLVQLRDGSVLHVGRNMTSMERAVGQLIWIDLLVGGAVLITLAGMGAALVRTSLRPLREIEQTAAAIARGDLTRRVPDPEPEAVEPKTELGRVSRTFNAMIAQIEAAFMARAQSETAARSAEYAARDAAAAAQASETRALRSEDRMRQFVADASHELRTPLTTIRGFAELYRQGVAANPDDAAKLVRRIEDEAARMGLLVEDLLLLARLDRERPLVLAPVELPVLAMDAAQAAKATAPDRVIQLEVLDDPERLVAYGDDARLRQVVGNLMTNALVHTPAEASVTLRLRAQPGNLAVLEVADTGPGLTPEQRERVFERFYRADAARTRHASTGTGLGLAIVAAIVAAHHGRVEVDSTPGGGTTFRVLLPTVQPAPDEPPES